MNDSPNAPNDAAHKRNERLNDDVSKRDEASEAARDENSGWPNQAVDQQTKKNLHQIRLKDLKMRQIFQEKVRLI